MIFLATTNEFFFFLIEEKIFTVDDHFVKKIIDYKYINMKYLQYFAPEIKPFINKEVSLNHKKYFVIKDIIEKISKEMPENFYELRKKGENESQICKLIREDSIKDFIVYLNRNSIPLDAKINLSIYETNDLILSKQVELIEYAAFYGSIQIINFLKNEGIELKPSLWQYSIHGKNSEIINLLDDSKVNPDILFKGCLDESIKCHHNDVTYYFLNNNFLPSDYENTFNTFISSVKYYNFPFIKIEQINEKTFCHLCCYDYYPIVEVLFKFKDVDINYKGQLFTDILKNNIFQ